MGMTWAETVSNLRTVLKTTATLLRYPSAARKLPRRWTQLTRVLWKARSKRLSAGSTTIPPPRRKNTKRSKRNSKALPCRSFKRWEVQQEDQEVCPTWEACLEEACPEAPLLLRTLPEDLRLKKLIKSVSFLFPTLRVV